MGQKGERDEERATRVPDPRDEPAPTPGDGRTLSGTPLTTAGGEEGGLPTVGIQGQPYGTRPGEAPSASPARATPEDEEARGASSPEGLLARTGRHGHDEPG